MKPGDFPTQDICDPKKPDEAFAWALVALPRIQGAALPMSSEYIQLVSQHLWDAGFRWHKSLQKKWWVAPQAHEPHWLTSPGRWVRKRSDIPVKKAPDMVDVLRAMKKVDEAGFTTALDKVFKEKRSDDGESS